jgi:DNA polymerase IIIc chi subunit
MLKMISEIYEFVDNNESNKSISRKKFLEYKKNNFTLIHNKYNEQTI